VEAAGGGHVGLVVLLLALAALGVARARAWPWLVLAFGMIAFSLGSMIGPVPGPFLFFNAALDAIARPLTQPVRYLIVGALGLSIAVGLTVDQLAVRKGPRWAMGALVLLMIEGLGWGGLSLKMPTTPLPTAPCATELEAGGVLVWPDDATDGAELGSQLYQMVHGQPAAHRGIASWVLHRGRVLDRLRGAGWRPGLVNESIGSLHTRALADLGYRWILVDGEADPTGARRLSQVLGNPVQQCGAVVIYGLEADQEVPHQ